MTDRHLGVLFNTDQLDHAEFLAYAQRLEQLGFESVWLPELFTRDPLATAGFLLGRTHTLRIATGIANIYARDPTAMVSSAAALQELSEGRFILGLGVSNPALNQARGHAWQNPTTALENYLTAMRATKLTCPQPQVPVYVAAHGPKMLSVVARMADGANTYLMPLDHVAVARSALGQSAALNTMLFCLHDEDAQSARSTARRAIKYYVGLDYYHNAWKSLGFSEDDYRDGGSDRLVDAVVAWGSVSSIHDRIAKQFEHGATRVVVIPIGAGLGGQPDWQLLEALKAVS